LSGPAPYEVATLTDSINAKWLSDVSMKPQSRISAYTKPMQLVQGMAKITTDDGVDIVIEAPTEFQFVSYSEIALSYGKLFARVSEQGHGFCVATPNAKVVDLGTEFAVLCHIDGNTEVHMYKGKANLFAGQKNENKISELLTAGAAKIVDRTDSIIRNIALAETLVVRTIDSKTQMVWKGQNLNLADVVGGGNGFGSGMPNAGVNVLNGQIADRLLTVDTVAGQEGYRVVPENKYIDGVFIPGVNGSGCKIASPGLTAVFPKTSGALWGYIFNGAMHKGMTTPEHALQLKNVTLGTPAAPAVCIHSNQGITFDLDEIRKDLQGLRITGFRAQTGISQTVQAALEKEGNRSFDQFPDIKQVFDAKQSKAEFWVFLDGQAVYHKELSSRDEPDDLTIPIGPAGRFLTLAVTESDDTQAYDWAVFARPELTLELSEP
jgi:hypothetical protein